MKISSSYLKEVLTSQRKGKAKMTQPVSRAPWVMSCARAPGQECCGNHSAHGDGEEEQDEETDPVVEITVADGHGQQGEEAGLDEQGQGFEGAVRRGSHPSDS